MHSKSENNSLHVLLRTCGMMLPGYISYYIILLYGHNMVSFLHLYLKIKTYAIVVIQRSVRPSVTPSVRRL